MNQLPQPLLEKLAMTSHSKLTFEEITHLYRREDGLIIPSVTQILSQLGCYATQRFFTEEGRRRGTQVHSFAENIFKGEPVKAPPEFEGYINALTDFQKDLFFEPKHIEYLVENRKLGFCGTVDLIGTIGNQNTVDVIVDIKSGAPDPTTGLQLAGYATAFFEDLEDAKRIRRFALHLDKAGKYKILEYSGVELIETWLAALKFYKWRKEHGKSTVN